jgi:hypothetical protein
MLIDIHALADPFSMCVNKYNSCARWSYSCGCAPSSCCCVVVYLCAAVPNGAEHDATRGAARDGGAQVCVEEPLTVSWIERGLSFWTVRWAGLGGDERIFS